MTSSRLALPALCASAALVASTVGLVAAPAQAEPTDAPSSSAACETYPADQLEEGQEVTGLTTAGVTPGRPSSKVEPESFTGTYLDTLKSDDGDTLVFDLKGSRITKADGTIDAGVWSGMSGSPVYAADGRLIGAVAYTFGGSQGSSIAGVTPAAALQALRANGGQAPTSIKLTSREKDRLVAAGADRGELGTGARSIKPVTAITLPSSLARGYATIAKRAGTKARTVIAGASGGTASLVCDGDVVGFGHPMEFANAQRTLHNASTALIQADGGESYKLANLGAPQGTLLHDGLAGVFGRLGALPLTTTVTSTASSDGKPARTYLSSVPNPDALAEIAATHAFRDAALAQDQLAGGESLVTWTVKGTSTVNGKPVEMRRTDRYSRQDSLAEYVGTGVASNIWALQDNPFSNIDVTDVTIDDTLMSPYKALKATAAERYDTKTRRWVKLREGGTISATKGRTIKLRITLDRANRYSKATKRYVTTEIRPASTAIGTGRIVITGGNTNSWDDEEEYFDDFAPWDDEDYYYDDEDELSLPAKQPTSAQGVADQLANDVRNDDLVVSQDYFTKPSKRSSKRVLVNQDKRLRQTSIVSGLLYFKVRYR
ncbi:MAG: hypothetical protein PGN15_03750 [Aeromicrobium erythreum]